MSYVVTWLGPLGSGATPTERHSSSTPRATCYFVGGLLILTRRRARGSQAQ
jgi:hypothetical protein